jgi:hypothetical protein
MAKNVNLEVLCFGNLSLEKINFFAYAVNILNTVIVSVRHFYSSPTFES